MYLYEDIHIGGAAKSAALLSLKAESQSASVATTKSSAAEGKACKSISAFTLDHCFTTDLVVEM